MTLKPIKGKIALKRLEDKEETGGIILPESSKEKSTRGEVVAVGDDCLGIQLGDTVIFPKWGGTEFEIESTTYIVLKAEEVLAIVQK